MYLGMLKHKIICIYICIYYQGRIQEFFKGGADIQIKVYF